MDNNPYEFTQNGKWYTGKQSLGLWQRDTGDYRHNAEAKLSPFMNMKTDKASSCKTLLCFYKITVGHTSRSHRWNAAPSQQVISALVTTNCAHLWHVIQFSFYSYRAYSCKQYTSQKIHLIKYNSWQILISYMFRHQCAILRESFISKQYKPNTLI